MANLYCTATNYGKGFFTHQDRQRFYLSGHPGDVWAVGNNAHGVSWINRVSGTAKTVVEAQAIVDELTEQAKTYWDALPEAAKAAKAAKTPTEPDNKRPEKHTLP